MSDALWRALPLEAIKYLRGVMAIPDVANFSSVPVVNITAITDVCIIREPSRASSHEGNLVPTRGSRREIADAGEAQASQVQPLWLKEP